MPLPSVFQGVQDCRLPALKPPKRFQRSRRPPRQQLLQLPSVSYMPQTSTMLLPNSYTYMPQDVQDCRLPGLKPSKRFRRPPRQQLLHAPGRSRLPFARPQTLQTLPQASKATTLTATTCPCHLFLRGFKTAVCPPSNPPNASNAPAGLQGNNSYSYMPLPSVFQGVQDCRLPALKPPKRFQRSRRPPRQQLLQLPSVSYMPQTSTMLLPNSYTYMPQDVQDCRLPGLKPPKRFRRPPRQQLLQLLHAPAICFSGGSRLPFARPQTPQRLPTLPQASKATTLTATTCPCHLFFRGFKTAVCPPSNPPNASNAPAGLQGNNSYSYMSPNPPNASNPLAGLPGPAICFSGVQDCRLPALKPPKRFQRSRRPPRQQLLQLLHAPAICFSGGSRLPFARPQTPQTLPTLPQASKATTLTATCPCHLFFRGFKTAVCPPSNPPNASNAPAGLQGNNSYSYPLSATCPRHLPCSCRTLTPTCPRTFKTAVCPASNPPNASAGLQGNNSYSYYMPLPSVFQGVQDCRLPALKPPKRFQRSRRPPRQQLLQLHAPAICFSGGSRLPFARPQTPQTLPTLPQPPRQQLLQLPSVSYMPPNELLRLHAPGRSRLPFARPQTLQTLPQASKATTLTATCPQTLQTLPTLSQASKATILTATCPCHLFFRGSRLPFARPQTPQTLPTLPQASKATTLTATCPQTLQTNFQPSRRPPRQQLLQLHAPAICFSGGSRLPFARPQTPQTLPTLSQASKATTLTATCPCHLFFRGFKTAVASTATCPCHLFFTGFKTAVCPASNPPNASNPPAGLQGNNSYSYMPLPSVFQGVQDCRLPALKPPKRFQRSRRPPRQQLLQLHVPAICFSGGSRLPSQAQLHAPAICFSGGSRLPFARPQTLQTLPALPQASKATTLTATCPCHLFFRGFKTAVCPPSNPPNASNAPAGLQGNNSYSYMSLPSVFHAPGFKTAVCPASNPPNASAGLQGNNSYMPQDVQDCRLPGLKPSKRFRRPPRQQLLQLLHAPAICFSGGSRLPFARPQTPQTLQTLPHASKATTLTATTCPCHLFFRGFKTAVCPPSNPPNASNAPAGLQGNNSYSYMPLPSTAVFHGVQDCRLPGLKRPKRF